MPLDPEEESEENRNEEEIDDTPPERPLECTECKKPLAVYYSEIIKNSITVTGMCADCPELQHRLHGTLDLTSGSFKEGAGLACGTCGTTMASIKMGNLAGCSECYTVFDEILLSEIVAAERVPPRLTSAKKGIPLHIGRGPGETLEVSPSLRLLALNEALNETLKKEDYEQAAWLRDQIKALTEKREEKGDAK